MATFYKTKKNRARLKDFLLIATIMTLVSGCVSNEQYPENSAFYVVGDVQNSVRFTGDETKDFYEIEKDGEKFKAVSLENIINLATPKSEEYNVLLVGKDGLTAEISNNKLSECSVAYSDKNGWHNITDGYPISSNIKLLDKIVVVSNEIYSDYVSFSSESETNFVSPGSIYKTAYNHVLNVEGTSEIEGETVTVYTRNITLPLESLLSFESSIAIFTKDGDSFHDRPTEQSAVLFTNNGVDYVKSTGEKVENVAGIIADPPLFSITEVYNDVVRLVQDGENVIVIELDGFGKNIFDKANEQGVIPFMSSLEVQFANAFYPTISNVNLASMFTGKKPIETGILSRDSREYDVEDIFETLQKNGKTSVYVEGSMSLLNSSLQPILSIPQQGESSDDAVYKNVLKAFEQNPNFIYAHFHGIDDDASKFGPYSEQNLKTVEQADRMVQEIAKSFDGTIMIVADHGVEQVEGGGQHDFVSYNNIVVPYIIYKGEKE